VLRFDCNYKRNCDPASGRYVESELEISTELATLLKEPGTGIYFDWGPDSSRYIPHAEKRAPVPDPEKLLEVLALSGISRMKNDAKDSLEG
jgi:hypothetical protein